MISNARRRRVCRGRLWTPAARKNFSIGGSGRQAALKSCQQRMPLMLRYRFGSPSDFLTPNCPPHPAREGKARAGPGLQGRGRRKTDPRRNSYRRGRERYLTTAPASHHKGVYITRTRHRRTNTTTPSPFPIAVAILKIAAIETQ